MLQHKRQIKTMASLTSNCKFICLQTDPERHQIQLHTEMQSLHSTEMTPVCLSIGYICLHAKNTFHDLIGAESNCNSRYNLIILRQDTMIQAMETFPGNNCVQCMTIASVLYTATALALKLHTPSDEIQGECGC